MLGSGSHAPSAQQSATRDWRPGAAVVLVIAGFGCRNASHAPSSPPPLAESSSVTDVSRSTPNEPSRVAAIGTEAEGEPFHGLPIAGGGAGSVAMGSPAAAGTSAAAVTPNADGSVPPSAAGYGGTTAPPNAAEPDYREIIASDWEVAPGEETYLCLRKTADTDLRIHRFRTVLPPGGHHLGLYVSPTPDKEDGTIECNLLETGERLIVGGAPGSGEFGLPPGVALRFDKGNQLLLQLHLLNPTEHPLPGRSFVQAVVLPEEAVKAEADVISAQILTLVIPPGQITRASGRCTFDRAQTLVSFGPHMHETGRHAKIVLHRAKTGAAVLHDDDYDFHEQLRYPLDLIDVAAGDYVDYECTYENTTGRTIYWGESASDEMCLVNLTRFPAGGGTLCVL